MRAVLPAMVTLLAPGLCWADWPEANPARPSFSDNAAATATGALEIEAGVATVDKGDSGVAQWTLKYGIDEHFDVRFNLENTTWGGDKAITGSSLLAKVVPVSPDDRKLGYAIEGYVTFPIADGEKLGGGGLAVSTYKRDELQVDACLVVDLARAKGANAAVTLTPVVAITHTIHGQLAGYVEPGIDLAVAGGGSSNPYIGAGLGFAVTKFLVLDAAFYLGDEPRTEVLAGLTYSMYVPPRHHHDPIALHDR